MYTCNFFWIIGVRYLSLDCRVFLRQQNISEDSQRCPKTSKDIQSLPKFAYNSGSGNSSDIAKRNLAPSAFYLKKEVHVSSFTRCFRFLEIIGLSLHIFGNCVKQSCNHSHFSIRHENLAHKHELAWDWSFQSAGVRLATKGVRIGRYMIAMWWYCGCVIFKSKYCKLD